MAELVLTDVENIVFRELQVRATRHGRTPAEEAEAILSVALHGEAPAGDGWEMRNRRRLELIGKSLVADLPLDQVTELEQLQAELDARLEPGDERLLGQLHRMSQAAAPLPSEPSAEAYGVPSRDAGALPPSA